MTKGLRNFEHLVLKMQALFSVLMGPGGESVLHIPSMARHMRSQNLEKIRNWPQIGPRHGY